MVKKIPNKEQECKFNYYEYVHELNVGEEEPKTSEKGCKCNTGNSKGLKFFFLQT